MRRRDFLKFIGGAAAVSMERPITADAQPKIRRLGVLSQGSVHTHPTPMFRTFQQGLHDLGWVEGHTLAIEFIAIENVRLLTELRARTEELGQSVEELRALGEVTQAVNST